MGKPREVQCLFFSQVFLFENYTISISHACTIKVHACMMHQSLPSSTTVSFSRSIQMAQGDKRVLLIFLK
jgi:hypothetical protein